MKRGSTVDDEEQLDFEDFCILSQFLAPKWPRVYGALQLDKRELGKLDMTHWMGKDDEGQLDDPQVDVGSFLLASGVIDEVFSPQQQQALVEAGRRWWSSIDPHYPHGCGGDYDEGEDNTVPGLENAAQLDVC